MNREERLEQLLTATVKLLDRWEECRFLSGLATLLIEERPLN